MIRKPTSQSETCQKDGYKPDWNVKRPAEVQEMEANDEKRRRK